MSRMLLVVVVLGCVLAGAAYADDIDDAVKLAASDSDAAIEKLAAIIAAARDAKDNARRHRAHVALGNVRMGRGEPYAALEHFEARIEISGNKPEDRIAYADALRAVAKKNIQGGGMGRNIQPFLRDALDVVKGLQLGRAIAGEQAQGIALPPGLRAPLVHIVAECRYLLGELDAALAALDEAGIDEQPAVGGLPDDYLPTLRSLRGHIRYGLKQYAGAAADWASVKNLVGAASAYDAARMPEKSMPIYAELLRQAPHDAGLLARAMAGARFTGSQATLLETLNGIDAPAGPAGVPLLRARAQLLEVANRPADALGVLRDAAARDPKDDRALVDVARLIVVTGDKASEDVWDAAAAAYAEALTRRPTSEGAALGLSFVARRDFGRLWQVWQDARVAARLLRVQRAIVAADPEDALALGDLGNIHRVLGQPDESLEAYNRARAANPFDPGVESDAGLALSGAGHADKALAAYERSLELDPSHLAGRQNAARAQWLAGDDSAAETHLGAAIRTARAIGRSPDTYRFLLDRIWRTRQNPKFR